MKQVPVTWTLNFNNEHVFFNNVQFIYSFCFYKKWGGGCMKFKSINYIPKINHAISVYLISILTY